LAKGGGKGIERRRVVLTKYNYKMTVADLLKIELEKTQKELDRLKLLLPDVVGRSEQLDCDRQFINAGTLQGQAMKRCLKCGKYTKAN
jgi:hypothetical protein